LRQVLTNLLSNAIKFTQAGFVQIRAWVEERGEQQAVLRFSVADTGPGVPEEEVGGLFEPFVQSGSGILAHEGTGLGLPISRQFVQLMGGDLWFTRQPGSGARFDFTIQVEIAEPTAVILEKAERTVTGLVPGQPEFRILIVEDKEYSRVLLRQLLESVGFQVHEAENGREAVVQHEQWRPHLTWMDMRMPVMNGYDATRLIRQSEFGKDAIIIALTASAFEEEKLNVLAAGCDDFVRKPFREAEIFDKMEEYLGVQFIYDDQPPITRTAPADLDEILSPEALSALPGDWLAALHDAATRARAEKIADLLADIETDHTPIARAIARLVDDFQFDKIMALTANR
jgi:CheY-like chemotaxis protein